MIQKPFTRGNCSLKIPYKSPYSHSFGRYLINLSSRGCMAAKQSIRPCGRPTSYATNFYAYEVFFFFASRSGSMPGYQDA
ncbi:hypothetical protein JTE90_028377 [Oedothorax gibbosus]|uniref:Uncharacterized protein n=1 Tax=Oedothorax gibbosus TaxID=931172 RepID=A0AAV6VDD5_9ARAC|nr:hypothetical protein JTE90_028377 [Oedothorax gibbosus]